MNTLSVHHSGCTDINQSVQPRKKARSLKFQIEEELCRENKDADDQLFSNRRNISIGIPIKCNEVPKWSGVTAS